MSETNRAVALRWMNEVWNERREETIDELLTADSVGHMEGGDTRGPEEFRKARLALLDAFPDLHVDVEATVCEGDSVVVRWRVTGTHTGDGLGFRATGSRVAFRGITWLVIRGGRFVEGWDSWNQGSLIQTLMSQNG